MPGVQRTLWADEEALSAREGEFFAQLESELRVVQDEFEYTDRKDAFTHLFVARFLGLSDDDAFEATEGSFKGRERGIDGFYIDEAEKTVFVFATSLDRKPVGPDQFVLVDQARAFLFGSQPDGGEDTLADVWTQFADARSTGFRTRFVIASLGKLNVEGQSALESLRESYRHEGCDIDFFDRTSVLVRVSTSVFTEGPVVTFSLPAPPLEFKPADYRTIVFPVNGKELAEVINKNRFSVFSLNLREYLGKNPVNKQIENTLAEKGRRKLFWYLNLGLDATCDSYSRVPLKLRRLEGNESQDEGIEFRNFRIVNGLQTALTLAHDPRAAAECYAMLRVVEASTPQNAFDIAVAKNRQTPIKGRDLFAQSEMQLTMQRRMERFNPPFFYERRSRDWQNQRSQQPVARRFDDRVVRNDDAARAYLATVLQDPFDAAHRGREIFYEFSGLYDEVFTSDLSAKSFIAADEVLQITRARQKQIRNELRDLEERSTSQPISPTDQTRLYHLSILVHAAWYLAALTWYLVSRGKTEAERDRFFTYDRPMDPQKAVLLTRVHSVAEKMILLYIQRLKRSAEDQKVRFIGARNVFARKGTYADLKESTDVLLDSETVKGLIDVP